jgi:hypothetical protein
MNEQDFQKRFGIQRTPEGGVSMGWTSIKNFRRCMRLGFWSRMYNGTGLQFPPSPPSLPALYGRMWHKLYCASWKNESLSEAGKALLAEEGLIADSFQMLVDEVQRDLDWYMSQPRSTAKLKVLTCEEEIRVKIGIHELRGTPDLMALEESGSIVMPDHKTFGCLSYTKTGSPKITPMPREETVVRYQLTRQFAFYCWLWNLTYEQKCYDAMLNLVPSHITQVLGILGDRDGNVRYPEIHRVDLEPYAPSYLDEVGAQALDLCDAIKAYFDYHDQDSAKALADALIAFPENEEACMGYGGSTCGFLGLCRGSHEDREFLLTEAFKQKG